MKKKGQKILLIAGIGVVVVLIALTVLAKVLITPERVRQAVLPLAEKALHRPVGLDSIEVGLFSGISCQGLSIGERQGEEPFVQAEELVLRYRLWPLLFGRVVVDEARVRRPVVRLVRNADGSFNFSDLLADEESPVEAEKRPVPLPSSSPINLLVSRVQLSDGVVDFIDRAVTPGKEVATQVSALNLSASGLSLNSSFPLKLDFTLNGAPLAWDGELDPAGVSVDGSVQIDELDVVAFSPYFIDAVPGQLQSLQLSGKLQLAGNTQKLVSRGTVGLAQIGLILDALPGQPIQEGRLQIDHDLDVEMEKGVLSIRSLHLAYNRLALDASGDIGQYLDAPHLDLMVKLPEISLGDVVQSLPSGLASDLSTLSLEGSVQGALHLLGSVSAPSSLLSDGELTLREVGVQVGHINPRLSGVLKLDKGAVSGKGLTLVAGDNSTRFTISARQLFEKTKYVAVAIEADKLDVAALLPPSVQKGSPGAVESGRGAVVEGSAGELGPYDLPLEVDGKVRIAEALYQGLTLEDFALDWRLQQNVLQVSRLDAQVASGNVQTRASVDLKRKGLSYDGNVQVMTVDAAALVDVLAPKAAGTTSGILDLSMELRGRGTEPASLKRNLTGGGRFTIRNGELTGAGIMQGLAQFLDVDDLRAFRFGLGEGTFKVGSGRVQLDAAFTGSQARLYPKGLIGLDTSLDLGVKTYLSPQNTRKLAGRGTFGELIADEQGWGLMPIRLAGTLANPKVSLDQKAMAEQVKKGTQRKLRQKLEEKVLDKIAPPQEQGAEEDPAKKLLRDTLKGLFGN